MLLDIVIIVEGTLYLQQAVEHVLCLSIADHLCSAKRQLGGEFLNSIEVNLAWWTH